MKHIERHRSRHTPAQLFDLVVDVERYPDFVPWVVAAKVIRRKENRMWVDLTVGASFMRKRFTTIAMLDRPHRVDIRSDDPMFECFDQTWTFAPVAEGGTNIEYQVDFRLRSHILQALIGGSFGDRTNTIVKAYMRRAHRVYGAS
jgi:coenzyme Q-binding protein COQ10